MSNNIYISEEYLQSILYEMKEIIEQDLIFVTPQGEIIASTDPSRLKTIHHGAKIVAQTGKDLIIHSDTEYKGAKKGISMRVRLNNMIIGVIGITGDSEEIGKYVTIIRRLTEILVKEGYSKDLENSEIEKDRMIIDSLIFSENKLEENYIIRYENLLGIKDHVERMVIVSTIVGHDNKRLLNKNKVFGLFRSILKNNKVILSLAGNNIVMMAEKMNKDQIEYMIHNIQDMVKQKTNLNLKFGIGNVQKELSNIRLSYVKAVDALKWSLFVDKKQITYYEDMDLAILLNNLQDRYIDEYIDKILGELSQSEYSEYRKIIKLYEKHNGSIKKISEELFIHKNTLQYKINKLCKMTGYDMRNLRDFMVLRLAFVLKNLIQ